MLESKQITPLKGTVQLFRIKKYEMLYLTKLQHRKKRMILLFTGFLLTSAMPINPLNKYLAIWLFVYLELMVLNSK